jgi:hypothetical protein
LLAFPIVSDVSNEGLTMRGVLRRILSDNAACVHRDRRAVSRRFH